MSQKGSVKRDNQTFIGLRLDPELLAAVDKKRLSKRLTRSQFIRDAIFEAVRDMGVPVDLIYPQDRVGEAKGGRPRKELRQSDGINSPQLAESGVVSSPQPTDLRTRKPKLKPVPGTGAPDEKAEAG